MQNKRQIVEKRPESHWKSGGSKRWTCNLSQWARQFLPVIVCTLFVFGLTLTAAAADSKGQKKPQTGKVVVVDKTAQAVVLDIKGKVYRFKFAKNVKVLRDGQEVSLDEVTPGQTISVVTTKSEDGGLEVVSLTINPSEQQSEAAGKGGNGKGKGPPPAPPLGPPPWAPRGNGNPVSPFN